MATIDTIIGEQRDLIQDVLSTARETTSRIPTSNYPSLNNPSLSYTFNKPSLDKPPSFGEILPGDTSGSTIAFLDENIDALVAQYFPQLNACLKDTPEKWLCAILTGTKPLGLSQAAFDSAWNQSRDREYRARQSEVAQVAQVFSASGFTLPPGAMLVALDRANQRASDAIGDVNRAQTIRDIELKWEMLRFAEEQAIQMKMGLMNIISDMYRTFLAVPDRDVQLFTAKAQAYSSAQSALSSYYQVELGFEQLRLRAEETRAGIRVDTDRNKISATSVSATSGSALASAANGFTNVASAAANAQSALIADLAGGNP